MMGSGEVVKQTQDPKRVLVTGSTGAVGNPVCRRLTARGHFVRGFARRPTPEVSDFVQGDLAIRQDIVAAARGMDAIVHLGAFPDIGDLEDDLIGPNIVGVYNVCDVARELGISRLVLGSSVRAVSGHPNRDAPIPADARPAPRDIYALTKVWLEASGEMFAACHGLSVIVARIGWLPRHRRGAEVLSRSEHGPDYFLSHDDAARFFERCVESRRPVPRESITLFATSRPKNCMRLDLEPSREVIGYEPEDTWPQGLPFEARDLG